MSILSGLLLVPAIAMLVATGVAIALQLRLPSLAETLLAAYVFGWAWLVATTMVLSLMSQVTALTLWITLALGAASGVGAWALTGQPIVTWPSASRARDALSDGPVLVLLPTVTAGITYAAVVGVGVAPNDGDSLVYHIPRALFWRQQQAVGWIADATDPRLNAIAPVGEIGQLATMLVTATDRYVATVQLIALVATGGAVTILARRLGGTEKSALFSGLVFASLPVVILQASTALTDLVVCSFLACAAVLTLSERRAAALPAALAISLALATKVSALWGLPLLLTLALIARPSAARTTVATIAAGTALGSWWYWLVVAHTGRINGGLAEDQSPEHSVTETVTTTRRLLLDVIDRSGVDGRDVSVFAVCALLLLVLAALALLTRGSDFGRTRALFFAALLVLVVPEILAPVGYRALLVWQKFWVALGQDDLAFRGSTEWVLSTAADQVGSWYGPVLPFCLLAAPVALLVRARTDRHRAALLLCSFAPLIGILLIALTVTYDPFRGRLIMFAVALAAVSWSALRRWPAVTWGVTGLAVVSMVMSLAMSSAAPSGLILFENRAGPVSRSSIWTKTRAEQQGQLRPGEPETALFRFFEENVPETASVGLSTRPNDFLAPYFGEGLTRTITLLRGRDTTRLGSLDWLVLSPSSRLAPCPADWHVVARPGGGWEVLRRLGRGGCDT